MENSGIRLSQLNETEFKQKFVTRQELVEESFNNSDLGFVYASKSPEGAELGLSNIVINNAKRELLGFRNPLTDYSVGEIAYVSTLPNNYRLECVVAGTTKNSSDEAAGIFTSDVEAGQLLVDGSVTWIVDDVRDGNLVGDIKFGYILRKGYLALNGQDVEASKYLRLYNFAVENGLMLRSVEDWENGKQGLFCLVSQNVFRVPDFRAMFVRGVDNERGMDENRQVGTYQAGTLVGGNDGDTQGANHSIVLDNNETNSFDKPANFQDEYGLNNVYYAYSHRLTDISWDDNANDYYGIVRPRNIALIAQIKY